MCPPPVGGSVFVVCVCGVACVYVGWLCACGMWCGVCVRFGGVCMWVGGCVYALTCSRPEAVYSTLVWEWSALLLFPLPTDFRRFPSVSAYQLTLSLCSTHRAGFLQPALLQVIAGE